ncbi:hypothetical protein LTR85_002865 [Meristemomyces frigidus]|nr:hypothetical protein LTR85_002865 [Meristemomyces frigidus]
MSLTPAAVRKATKPDSIIVRRNTRQKPSAPSPEQSCARAPRQQYSIDGIKRSLGLADQMYREFYTLMEREMTRRGWIGHTFRSIAEKETVQRELSTLVLANRDHCERFPATAASMQSAAGQAAFQGLVYKIGSNFRRRTKQQALQGHQAPDLDSDVSETRQTRVYAGVQQGEQVLRPASATSGAGAEDKWQHLVSIIREDGHRKAVGRVCEFTRGWPRGRTRGGLSVDDLDFGRFLSILEDGYAFSRTNNTLCWEDSMATPSQQPESIDNDREWKAVIAHLMLEGQPLNFVVKARTRT